MAQVTDILKAEKVSEEREYAKWNPTRVEMSSCVFLLCLPLQVARPEIPAF